MDLNLSLKSKFSRVFLRKKWKINLKNYTGLYDDFLQPSSS